ncbi:zinc-dependent metalloprotease [Planctomicrobium sp. SH668]|uniref:zinc-dependent metalloprotease n=1 Tax=Planctomicrobium sp. SH668 TaxID=3448126 RepID=UPI003F5B6C23
MMRRFVVSALMLSVLVISGTVSAQEGTPAKSKFDQLIEKKKKVSGMWTAYYGDQQILIELSADALKKEYFIVPSISRGISQGQVLGGMSWGFGDDAIWAFKKSEDKVFVLQRNVRFRAKPNSPEASAVQLAYSDSILYSLPILTQSPSGGTLVDMTQVFMNDDLQIGPEIGPGFRFAGDRSTVSSLKAFSENLELQINAVYSGSSHIETVPNSRGVQVGVHYSVSVLPPVGSNGFKPRVADDRVGYFLTAVKDFSDRDDPDHFVRYVNRWNLQKLDPELEISIPKEQIVFYIENTVPVFLRPTVEAGILEWNKAFEKLGFSGAIKVNRQPADPSFDPENIHYNTFRWITADAGMAMGPSRIDPRTGQILDADIIFDASFLDSWSSRWETYRSEEPKPAGADLFREDLGRGSIPFGHRHSASCNYCQEMQRYNGFAAAVFAASDVSKGGELPLEFVHEGIKEVVMHEVGHTLGLRHNFKASTWKSLEEMQDKEKSRAEGIVASVMDYTPPNIHPDKAQQGLYYTQTLGPYDYWAIEYGYRPFSANEAQELKKIASRSGEPALAYTTDEDTRGVDPDPHSARFDLGKDPLEYAKRQMEVTTKSLPGVLDRVVKEGDGYQRGRQAFRLLMGEYWKAAGTISQFPGGVYLARDHKGDKDARAPFVPVEPAKQREAMKILSESAFAPPPVQSKDLNYLAVSRWSHWGMMSPFRQDFAVHDETLMQQDAILGRLLSGIVLDRILENEFRVEAGQDAYTLAEHLTALNNAVFSEWAVKPEKEKYDNRDQLILGFRRNLQRQAIRRLASLVSQQVSSPADARTLTRIHLEDLKNKAQALLATENLVVDDYTRAHLLDSVSRIDTVLKAEMKIDALN